MRRPELRALPPPFRLLCAGYLVTLGLAYAVALLFVFAESGMTPKGIETQFRGGAGPTAGNGTADALGGEPSLAQGEEAAAEAGGDAVAAEDSLPSLGREWQEQTRGMRFPKPFKEMILSTHLHLLSISGILFLVGGLFACSSFPERAKGWVIAAGFAGLALDYACMWGVRYAGPGFSAGVFLFGFAQSLSLAIQMLASLKDLGFPGRARA
jgi:hypothetical protein